MTPIEEPCAPEPAASASAAALPRSRPASYHQIVRSSALIGGASIAKIGIGIVRMKAIAVMLGPAGVGLMGLYASIADLVQSVAGMGINSSGVRQIAEAVGSGETKRIAQTATVLKWIAPLLGLLGALLLIVFSRQVSILTFGSDSHSGAIALLSIAVFCTSVAGGQTALIQGMRRVRDLAGMSLFGALGGTIIGIPMVYLFRENGVVPALIGVSVMTIATSWWYSRKVPICRGTIQWEHVKREVAELLKLGSAFMASGVLTMGAAYAIRAMIVLKLGLQPAGLYQSSWGIGGLYVGIVLQSMGADFYPRLTANSSDHEECNRLVNEQAQVSLLLAGPGVIATLTFAPLVLALFYSAKFGAAVEILRWICLGMTLRVVSWPIGFILLAKGERTLFFWTEAAAAAVHSSLAWLFIARFGLNGAGAAFFGLNVWHGLLIYTIVRRLTGFHWSAENLRVAALFLPLVALTFLAVHCCPFWLATTVGITALLTSCLYSASILLDLLSAD